MLSPPALLRAEYLFWWSIPVSAYIFFLFFGLGEEARKEYSRVITLFRRYVLRQAPAQDSFAISCLPNSKAIRPFKINSLASFRSSEKDMSARSTSPTETTSYTPKNGKDVEWDSHSDMPPLPDYSTDVEAGHHRLCSPDDRPSEADDTCLEMEDSFQVPRAYTASIVVECGSAALPVDQRPFSLPSICPAHLPHDGEPDCDSVHVTVQTVQYRNDNLV